VSKNKTQPIYNIGSTIEARSPERATLAELIQQREDATEALATAVKRRQEIETRLAQARYDARPLEEDNESGRELGDIDTLIAEAAIRKQQGDAAEQAIVVLERALKIRALEESEAGDAVAGCERLVARAARVVLSGAMAKLFDGLPEMETEVIRRRFALAFLLRNQTALDGFGQLNDEAKAIRSHLAHYELPSHDFVPAEHLNHSHRATWQAALEALSRSPDAPLPG